MPEPFPFGELSSQLDEIDSWLKSLGYAEHDRIRKYRANIRHVIEAEATGSLASLQDISAEKSREVFWSYVEADEFARAVIPLRARLGNWTPAMPIDRALQGPADLFLENPDNSHARNFMFELIMAGRIAKAGISPRFDQGPDLQFDLGGIRVSVQCKRPLSTLGLKSNILKAMKQLRNDSADLRLIAISVSRLLTSGEPLDIPHVANAQVGQAYLDDRSRQIADDTGRFWFGKLDRAGIFFYGFTPVWWRRPHGQFSFASLRSETLCPVATDVLTRERLTKFRNVLGA